VGHGEMNNAYKILVMKLKGRNYLGDLGIDEGLMLRWILKKQSMTVWAGLIWLRTECVHLLTWQ
jgi:hypothetical protein